MMSPRKDIKLQDFLIMVHSILNEEDLMHARTRARSIISDENGLQIGKQGDVGFLPHTIPNSIINLSLE